MRDGQTLVRLSDPKRKTTAATSLRQAKNRRHKIVFKHSNGPCSIYQYSKHGSAAFRTSFYIWWCFRCIEVSLGIKRRFWPESHEAMLEYWYIDRKWPTKASSDVIETFSGLDWSILPKTAQNWEQSPRFTKSVNLPDITCRTGEKEKFKYNARLVNESPVSHWSFDNCFYLCHQTQLDHKLALNMHFSSRSVISVMRIKYVY